LTGEIFQAVTAHTHKDNATRKWYYVGKAYITDIMEERGSIYKILNYKMKLLLQLPTKETKPLQMSYCNDKLQVNVLLPLTFHGVITQCGHKDSNLLGSYAV
jgi:hypothetical protein